MAGDQGEIDYQVLFAWRHIHSHINLILHHVPPNTQRRPVIAIITGKPYPALGMLVVDVPDKTVAEISADNLMGFEQGTVQGRAFRGVNNAAASTVMEDQEDGAPMITLYKIDQRSRPTCGHYYFRTREGRYIMGGLFQS